MFDLDMPMLTYDDLSRNYPLDATTGQTQKIGGGCKTYLNQCAIRLSKALTGAGFSLDEQGFGDPTCTVNQQVLGRGAEPLANFLWHKIGPPRRVKGATAKSFPGRGIIFFRDIVMVGYSGDHIDLWDGSKTKSGAYFSESSEVWFFSLPRNY